MSKKDDDFKDALETKIITTNYVVRDIKLLIETLEETGETEIAGCVLGWQYNMKRVKKDNPREDLS
jgi:hypothetical protein